MHEYRSKEELKGLGCGVWNSGGGVHRLGPSQRQHLQSVEKQEPEIRSSSLPPSEPNSGQGSEIKHWQAFSIDWYGKENFRAAQQESTGSIKQRMGSEIVAGGQRSGTIHRTEISIAPKEILNRSVIEGVTEIVQTREPAWCGGNNQDERGYEVVPPGNGMRRKLQMLRRTTRRPSVTAWCSGLKKYWLNAKQRRTANAEIAKNNPFIRSR